MIKKVLSLCAVWLVVVILGRFQNPWFLMVPAFVAIVCVVAIVLMLPDNDPWKRGAIVSTPIAAICVFFLFGRLKNLVTMPSWNAAYGIIDSKPMIAWLAFFFFVTCLFFGEKISEYEKELKQNDLKKRAMEDDQHATAQF